MLIPKHLRQQTPVGQSQGQQQKPMTSFELPQLAELLVTKDKELKHLLILAQQQQEIQQKSDSLRAEVEQQDQEIKKLQTHFKEAEHVLATSIYQAKQKLSLISKANDRVLSSEELIKYAHKISASHAVAAPYNWEVGDPRRPYPTDIEMRSGLLGQVLSDSLLHAPTGQATPGSSGIVNNSGHPLSSQGMAGAPGASPFHWSVGTQDVKPNLSQLPPPSDSRIKHESLEDVEVMSSDSSSSSSSDSQ
jgi:mediator of RNA polymerase II transcription subunit 4